MVGRFNRIPGRKIETDVKPAPPKEGVKHKGDMVTKEQMDALKDRFVNAKTESERQAVDAEMHRLCEDDAASVAEIMKQQLQETHKRVDDMFVRKQLEEMLPAISLSYIAKNYFKKSRSWLYQRINGLSINGKPAKFSEDEIETLNFALNDIGQKLSNMRVF